MARLIGQKGFTLVEIMIVVGIIASLATIAIPNILRARVNANDAAAKATLKAISTAAEEYAGFNRGKYPTSIANLTNANPPYLNENYTAAPKNGYNFSCTWSETDYNCTASPVNNGTTGNKVFSMRSGVVLTETDVVSALSGTAGE